MWIFMYLFIANFIIFLNRIWVEKCALQRENKNIVTEIIGLDIVIEIFIIFDWMIIRNEAIVINL